MDNHTMNPWHGLRSYQEGETIYGRTEEIASLVQCILANVQTVLYGKSGIGKTSLLNAGVIPLVRKKGVFPVNIRLEHNSKPYFTQISRAVFDSLNHLRRETIDENGDKVVTFEAGTIIERVKPIADGKETLWEFFHRHEFFDPRGDKLIPLLLFDQFEEIFTKEKDSSKVKTFFSELADLINGVIPEYICNATNDYNSQGVVSHEVPENGLSFNVADYNITSGQYNNYLTSSDFHVVFSLREDYLSYLERETVKIPSLRQNRYCLQSINEEQAAIIIMNPIPGLVSKDVAELIINKVIGDNQFDLDGVPERQVDAAILSLYLSRLYDSLPENERKITHSLVESEADNIIASYYSDSIIDIPSDIVEYLEDNLVNGEGIRESISVYKAKHEGNLTDELLRILIEDKKLLRQFDYGGRLMIEFIHDKLCPIVARRKEFRSEIKKQQEIEQRNQQEAQRLEEERKSILAEKAQNRKRTAFLLAFATGLALVAFVIILMSINNKKQAEELTELNREVNVILPLVIEQQIKKGDTYSASALLLRLFPDSLYMKGEPIRTSLLRQLSNNHALTLNGHDKSVNAAKYTKDGKYVITGSDDQTLKVWDAKIGILKQSYSVNVAISSIAVGPDDRTIVIADKCGTVETCFINSGSIDKKKTVTLVNTYARFVTFNPSGTEIIVCCDNGDVMFFDAEMTIKDTLKISKMPITYIAFDSTGTRMILAGADKTIKILDAVNKNTINTLSGVHKDWVRSLDISPDGHILASCSDDRTVRLWDLDKYNCFWHKTLSDWITNVRFTPDGNRIVVSSRDGVLRTFDVKTGEELIAFQINHSGYILGFDLSPDGHQVVTCTSTPTVHIWDYGESMDTGIDIPAIEGTIYGISLINGSNRFAAASNSGYLGVWDYKSGKELFLKKIGKGDNGRVQSLQTSPDGRYIALSTKFQIRLFDAVNGEEIEFDNTNGHRGWVRDLAFSNDGQTLASVGEDKRIILWSIPKKKVLKCIDAHSAGIYSVGFSHNDSLLVTGSADSTICQWNITSGKQIKQPIVGHTGVVLRVIYSQDDTKILSTSGDKTACLWDTDGNIIQQYIGASGWMNDICYNYSDDEVITASNDKSIRIWCSLNGRESAKLDGHLGAVMCVALSKDGILISGDTQGEIKIWQIPRLEKVADDIIENYKGVPVNLTY